MKKLMVIVLISFILFQTSCSMNDIFVARQSLKREKVYSFLFLILSQDKKEV